MTRVLEMFQWVTQGYMKPQEVDVHQFRQTVNKKVSWIVTFLQILTQETREEAFSRTWKYLSEGSQW